MKLPQTYVKVTSREHLASLREGRITSSQAGLLLRGSEKAWQKLADNMLNPPPYYAPTSGPMALGVERESEAASLFQFRHPDMDVVGDIFGFHAIDPRGDRTDMYRFVGFTPDRIVRKRGARGRWTPLEVKNIMRDDDCSALVRVMKESGRPASKFRAQIMWHAWCSGTSQCYLVVNSPGVYEEFYFTYTDAEMRKIKDMVREFAYQAEGFMIEGARKMATGG